MIIYESAGFLSLRVFFVRNLKDSTLTLFLSFKGNIKILNIKNNWCPCGRESLPRT